MNRIKKYVLFALLLVCLCGCGKKTENAKKFTGTYQQLSVGTKPRYLEINEDLTATMYDSHDTLVGEWLVNDDNKSITLKLTEFGTEIFLANIKEDNDDILVLNGGFLGNDNTLFVRLGSDTFKKLENDENITDVVDNSLDTDESITQFSASPDWDNYSCWDMAIQVDDVILSTGGKVSDLIEKLESSSVASKYSFEYNENELVLYKQDVTIHVKKNGLDYFCIYASNLMSESRPIALKDCIVKLIGVEYGMDEELGAIGLMPSDVKEMDYDEIEDYIDNYFDMSVFNKNEMPSEYNGKSALVISIAAEYIMNNTAWAGVKIWDHNIARVYIDAETGKGIYASRESIISQIKIHPDSYLVKENDIPSDIFDKLLEETEQECITDINNMAIFSSEKVKEIAFTGMTGFVEDTSTKNVASDAGFVFIYHYVLENGKDKYMAAKVSELRKNPVTDEILYGPIWTTSYKTIDDIKQDLTYSYGFDDSDINELGNNSDSFTEDASLIKENNRDYIFPKSSEKLISMKELEGLSAKECKIARNEIYARHGRKFKDEELQAYFKTKDWYEGTVEPEDFDEHELNDIEIKNKDIIASFEKDKGYN